MQPKFQRGEVRVLKAASLLSLSLLSACAVGRNIKDVRTATSPHGVDGWMEVAGRKHTGEVLTVSDSTIVMLTATQVIEVPAERVQSLDFRPFLVREEALTEADLRLLRAASRFPYGIPENALTRLLARGNQTSIERIDR